ncbi:hypothetical protein [Mycobacterium sp. PSTR-4-N]|uniref:hypothetical protein n=1 Tax=Mycobacterium sp. PSTR-4-N TaxID=2917745 RepID=UPI001F157187|nr:hypothetical protein [Mycobacterium sp. PSTR-4-N]MCG7594396.1 hypothetical protein [Mycobacterium sp. PSTR-4-N]
MTATDQAQFDRLAAQFAEQLAAVQDCTTTRYVRADWAQRNADLARFLLPVPPWDFLRHPAIRYQMFVGERLLPEELPYVLAHLDDVELLAEDPVGMPPTVAVPDTSVLTSSNTVHQLHHLARYQGTTGRSLRDVDTVVEWGGGFGSLARLLVRWHGSGPTVVLIDTPVFSALQWLYLSATVGADRVVLHQSAPVALSRGKVNVVPIGLVPDVDVTADLFISMWALNESTSAAQRDVVQREWFSAEHLLLAMHAGDPFAETVRSHGARDELLGTFMPGQEYLIR